MPWRNGLSIAVCVTTDRANIVAQDVQALPQKRLHIRSYILAFGCFGVPQS